jgi:hypothetical protein
MMATFFERPGSEGEFIGIPMKDKNSWETLRDLVGTLEPGRTLSPMLEEKLRGGEVVGLISHMGRIPKKVQRDAPMYGYPREFQRSVDSKDAGEAKKTFKTAPVAKVASNAPAVPQSAQAVQTKTAQKVAGRVTLQSATNPKKPALAPPAQNLQGPKTAVSKSKADPAMVTEVRQPKSPVIKQAQAPPAQNLQGPKTAVSKSKGDPAMVTKVRQPKSPVTKRSDLVTLNLTPILKALTEKENQMGNSVADDVRLNDTQGNPWSSIFKSSYIAFPLLQYHLLLPSTLFPSLNPTIFPTLAFTFTKG